MEIFFLLHDILMNEYKDMPASQYGGERFLLLIWGWGWVQPEATGVVQSEEKREKEENQEGKATKSEPAYSQEQRTKNQEQRRGEEKTRKHMVKIDGLYSNQKILWEWTVSTGVIGVN